MQQVEQQNRPAPEWDIGETRRIVLSMLRGCDVDVYLFGSAATGKMTRHSDIDVAVLGKEPLPSGVLAQIREALDESDILYKVDVVDLNYASADLIAKVHQQGKLWSD